MSAFFTPQPPESIAISLAELRYGASAEVVAVDAPGLLGERLMEMAGLTPGTRVTVLHNARSGRSMRLSLRGAVLSLEGDQARAILVAPLG